MIEKKPATKNRKFKTFLKIISLPILISTIAIWINYDFFLSVIDKQYDKFLVRKYKLFPNKDSSIIRAVSLDKEGVIFDEIIEPKWTGVYQFYLGAIKTGIPLNWDSRIRLEHDFYANLLIEVDQIEKDGSTKRIIDFKSNHQHQSNELGAYFESSSKLTNWFYLRRGGKYHIRVINQLINPDMLNKPYAYHITLTDLNNIRVIIE